MELQDILYPLAILYVCAKVLEYFLRLPKRTASAIKCKNILITGCDYGFGSLFAKKMDAQGFNVYAGCLTEKGRRDLEKSCSRVTGVIMDVTKENSVREAYKIVSRKVGKEGLWAIVNNAGIVGKTGLIEWYERQDYQEVFDVNVLGMVSVTRQFLPLVKKNKGRIVNTASIVGRLSLPAAAPYDMSKHAVEAYSDVLRMELRAFGVSVHIIEPGAFKTNLVDSDSICANSRKVWDKVPPAVKKEYGEKFFKQLIGMVQDRLPMIVSSKVHYVPEAYEHAVLAYWPRARYLVGYEAKLFAWPLIFAPEWLTDFLFTVFLPKPASVE